MSKYDTFTALNNSNPILTPDANLFLREKIQVIQKPDNTFIGWYCQHPTGSQSRSQIYYMTSLDGLTWIKVSVCSMIGLGGSWQDPTILQVGNEYWMWVERHSDWQGTEHLWQICLWKSSNGITWTFDSVCVESGGSPYVWQESGRFFMLYESIHEDPYVIALASSPDGSRWIDVCASPVFRYPEHSVPDSMIVDEQGLYHQYYHVFQRAGNTWPAYHATCSNWVLGWENETLLLSHTSPVVVRLNDDSIRLYTWNLADDNMYAFAGVE